MASTDAETQAQLVVSSVIVRSRAPAFARVNSWVSTEVVSTLPKKTAVSDSWSTACGMTAGRCAGSSTWLLLVTTMELWGDDGANGPELTASGAGGVGTGGG